MLILSDGYWNAVSSDAFCDQIVIIISKGLKCILLSANLVNEGLSASQSLVQFLIDGRVSTLDQSLV